MFWKKSDPNTKVNNLFCIHSSVTSRRPLESDELNRSVPYLASSIVIDSDISPISVADSASQSFLLLQIG